MHNFDRSSTDIPMYKGLFSFSFYFNLCIPASRFTEYLSLYESRICYQLANPVVLEFSQEVHFDAFAHILDGLPEDRIVHQLEQVLMKTILCLLSQSRVKVDVGLHPR